MIDPAPPRADADPDASSSRSGASSTNFEFQQASRKAHLPSLFLALVSGFGLVVGLLGALLLGIVAVVRPGSSGLETRAFAWVAGMIALLNLPALIYSIPPMLGRPAPRAQIKDGWRLASIALLFWAVVLAAASYLNDHPTRLTAALLPPLSLLAVGLPIWWLIEMGRHGLRSTPQRTWGTVSVSLIGAVPLTIVVELLAFAILGILILVWLAGTSPDLLNHLQRLENSISNGNVGPENLISLLQPYLEQPGVIAAGLLVLSVLTPLIEETLKPLALWFVPGRRMNEAEGFTLGLVAGGIFALFETLGSLSGLAGRGELWLTLVLVRVGTGLLHITCSGLVGWGLAAAWSRARYVQLGGSYLLAILIHGSWNLFAQLLAMTGLLPDNSPVSIAGRAAPFVMAAEAALIFWLLLRTNRRLNRAFPPEPLPIAPEVLPVNPPEPTAFNNPQEDEPLLAQSGPEMDSGSESTPETRP